MISPTNTRGQLITLAKAARYYAVVQARPQAPVPLPSQAASSSYRRGRSTKCSFGAMSLIRTSASLRASAAPAPLHKPAKPPP